MLLHFAKVSQNAAAATKTVTAVIPSGLTPLLSQNATRTQGRNPDFTAFQTWHNHALIIFVDAMRVRQYNTKYAHLVF